MHTRYKNTTRHRTQQPCHKTPPPHTTTTHITPTHHVVEVDKFLQLQKIITNATSLLQVFLCVTTFLVCFDFFFEGQQGLLYRGDIGACKVADLGHLWMVGCGVRGYGITEWG